MSVCVMVLFGGGALCLIDHDELQHRNSNSTVRGDNGDKAHVVGYEETERRCSPALAQPARSPYYQQCRRYSSRSAAKQLLSTTATISSVRATDRLECQS